MKMTLRKSPDVRAMRAELLVVPVAAEAGRPEGAAAQADALMGGVIGGAMLDREIRGTTGELTIVHTGGHLPAARVAVVGVGAGTPDDWRAAGRAVGSRARTLGAATVALALGELPAPSVAAMVSGFAHGQYRFTQFTTDPDSPPPPVRTLHVHAPSMTIPGVSRLMRLCEAVDATRDLGNTPANVLTPTALADHARSLAAELPGLSCTVLGPRELTRLRAGALLAVAAGSSQPPRMIVLRWNPPGHRRGGEVLGLVGKAVTFDSGGISIKPAAGMGEMKLDMAGGAAVIEATGLIARLGVATPVVAVVPATENMPGGEAMRPGDVVRAMSGRTVEIIDTDAEGRLILADALHHAVTRGKATRLLDLATLTGAMVTALGEGVYAGLFGDDDDWTGMVRRAGDDSGDLCWQLPIHPGYKPALKSKVADCANLGAKRAAGAITAAMFLQQFTGGVPWCHLDIAGTGMVGGEGTGYGVGLMLHLAEALSGR